MKITFDIRSAHYTHQDYGWRKNFEAFCVCRHCNRTTVFALAESKPHSIEKVSELVSHQATVNDIASIEGYVSSKDGHAEAPPEHLPENIEKAFKEGAICLAVHCPNAAATMFRLCVDHASATRIPEKDENGLTPHVRRTLGLRLKWLFDNGRLPQDLRSLSNSIKEDGNDGAHAGSLDTEDTLDLLDFTRALLERLYTEPAKIKIAEERRLARRKESK